MDMILVKIFATALALSEVMTQPQAVKTHFDPAQDRDQVVQILRDGCAHMRKAFDIESINVDDLISTALDDPKALGSDIKAFHGINFADLNTAYRQFCKNESVEQAGGRSRQGHRVFQQRGCRSARPDAAQGQEAAQPERRSRRQGQRFRRCVRARQPPGLGFARRCSGFRAEGVCRRRRPALLRAPRR